MITQSSHKTSSHKQSSHSRPSPLLSLVLASFLSSAVFVAGPTLAEAPEYYADEDDFLRKADAGWAKIATGVYEKRSPDGETIRHGFGLAAFEFFLESTRLRKQELLDLAADSDMASYSKALAELDLKIADLEATMAQAREKSSRGGVSDAPCTVTVSIYAVANCLFLGGGEGQAGVSFIDFGPCNSANATATAAGTPGGYQHATGPLTCYEGRTAGAACVPTPSGCSIYSSASIDFTTCELYQIREAFRFCPSPGVVIQ